MTRQISMTMVCLAGMVLVTGVRADEPAAGSENVTTVERVEVYEDAGYARISHDDWTAPQSTVYQRSPVVYQRMHPHRFYGAHGPAVPGPVRRYSIIAMPNDSSQLGYYYKHVPSWQPRANMLPPIPRPSRWHLRHPASSVREHGPVIEDPQTAPAKQQAAVLSRTR